jgi:hypothetical protein
MSSTACKDCGNDIPLSWNFCSHCGRPGLFPNVRAAQMEPERTALDARYQAALRAAEGRGCRKVAEEFEAEARRSKAVISRALQEAEILAGSDQELYTTYYKKLDAEIRLPHGNKWDRLRRIADEALFSGYKEDIRFGALSLNRSGIPSYGECTLVLREDMIAHRASTFEENSTLFMKAHGYDAPPGYRSNWPERAKLCVAKLAGEIDPTTTLGQFAGILIQPGSTPEKERFIEVHIWGPISRRALESVRLQAGLKPRRAVIKALRERLAEVGATLEVA